MNIYSTKRLAASCIIFAGLSLSAHADTITAGNPAAGSMVDSCRSCDYIVNDAFGANGYTVTSYTFLATQSGDITPVLFTRTNSGGNATFTVVGVGQSQSVASAGTYTFSFGLTAGTDLTSVSTYFGFFSNSPMVAFSYFDSGNPPVNANGGNFFVVPGTTTINDTTTSNYSSGYATDALGANNNRIYGISADAVSGAPSAVPEPSSIALLGTGVLSVAGVIRRRIRA